MSDAANTAETHKRRSLLDTLEIDPRLMGMVGALILICVCFQFWTGIRAMGSDFSWNPFAWWVEGRFLIPQNTFNIAVQTISIAIMAR